MIFGKDLGRSAFFAEIGSEVERLDSIPSNYANLVCIGQGVRLTDTVGREYRIDLFISPPAVSPFGFLFPLPVRCRPTPIPSIYAALPPLCGRGAWISSTRSVPTISSAPKDRLPTSSTSSFAPVLRVSPTKAMSARLSPQRWLMANCSSRSSTQPPHTRSLPAVNSLTASLQQKALTQTT